jgi:hypothetical protein
LLRCRYAKAPQACVMISDMLKSKPKMIELERTNKYYSQIVMK